MLRSALPGYVVVCHTVRVRAGFRSGFSGMLGSVRVS